MVLIKALVLSFLFSVQFLHEVVQGSCEFSLPGSVQGHAGRGFEQPVLVEGVLAHV